ncbi:MAG: alpha/beta hydrolase [Flavobacteriales bacterium CG_4_9_14_3_um_filter_40_17]|nr:MAG: alpha/beta hydrolase [Flavobacteriales bacterium CG_4_9_14_3_um_filter_40_17]
MKILRNIQISGQHGKPILLDVFYKENRKPKPLVIFSHGYKGFKDWGCWDLAAQSFAQAGCFFVKFNFSHNGTTSGNPLEFGDLEAFGQNNFIKELDDLDSVIHWVKMESGFKNERNINNLTLIGHSRGGGVVALKASENQQVTKLITWAAVSDFESRFPKAEQLEIWKKQKVVFVENARTKQQMPHYYQFYENFQANKERLNIQSAVRNMDKPFLILHGAEDMVVPIKDAKNLRDWSKQGSLKLIGQGNHVFGGKHPYTEKTLPKPFEILVNNSIDFVKSN